MCRICELSIDWRFISADVADTVKLHIDPRRVLSSTDVDEEVIATRLWAFWTTFTAVSPLIKYGQCLMALGIGRMAVTLYGAGVQ